MSEVGEIPTFFGPPESPLFGILHVPAGTGVRGAVLICPSIGKDASDSTMSQRLMADGLARHGAAVLRFDYLGCGDSSYEDTRPDAFHEWQASIDHAISYLRAATDVDDLSLVAMRAGCLIASAAARTYPSLRSVTRIVFVDPAGTGKRFLREQSTFFKMAAEHSGPVERLGPVDQSGLVDHGGVSIIGAQVSAQSARELNAERLSGWPTDPPRPDTLVVTRSDGPDAAVAEMIEREQPEVHLSAGLREAAQPTRLLAPTPLDAVDAVVNWLTPRLPKASSDFHPTVTDHARMPDGAGGYVVERIERIEPNGLFAIRTTPDAPDDAGPLPTVVFFTNAVNPHHGPNRAWVHIARTAACRGHQALRWDRRGAGESGPSQRDAAVRIYSQEGVDDALAATRHARDSSSGLLLVGLCSGAWFAAHGGRTVGAESLALVNVLLWSWHVKGALRQPIAPGDDDVTDWEQSPRARMRRIAQSHLPAPVWRALGRTGAVQAPENVLAGFARKGTSVTTILCPDDARLFYANQGGNAIKRLRKTTAPPKVVETQGGDHAAFQPVVLGPLARCVLDTLDDFAVECRSESAARPVQ